jgi:hypothetical protein
MPEAEAQAAIRRRSRQGMRMRLLSRCALLAGAAIAGALTYSPRSALADVREISAAQQFGVADLP